MTRTAYQLTFTQKTLPDQLLMMSRNGGAHKWKWTALMMMIMTMNLSDKQILKLYLPPNPKMLITVIDCVEVLYNSTSPCFSLQSAPSSSGCEIN